MSRRRALHGLHGEKRVLAARVLEYLTRYPNASDTLEGIARFWLRGDCPATSREMEEVMIELVDRGLVERRLKPDGEWIYRRTRDPAPAAPREGAGT